MSGGSRDYICYTVERELLGRMEDAELDRMIVDFGKLLHDLEWWTSGDIEEDAYRKTVKEFKKKWFKSNPKIRTEEIINEKIEELRKELNATFAYLGESC